MIYIVMLLVVSVMLVVVSVACIIVAYKLRKSNAALVALNEENENLTNELNKRGIEYSKEVLEYLRMFVSQVSVMKFKEFADGHDISKITENIVKNLIRDVATYIEQHIVKSNLDYDNLLFDERFIEEYIIQSTIMNIKELWTRSVDQATE